MNKSTPPHIDCQTLCDYLNHLLMPAGDCFGDYAPNGMQIEGSDKISNITTAVTASHHVCEQSAQINSNLLLVHHGIFWNRDERVLTGSLYQRTQTLIKNNINLLAYHLPLDTHPIYGNNEQLGQLLGWTTQEPLTQLSSGTPIGSVSNLTTTLTIHQLEEQLTSQLKHAPLIILNPNHHPETTLKRVAWCTGAAGDWLHKAADLKADAYITGEISERHYHEARERGITLIAAGHHATERYGVQAIGKLLADTFHIKHQFLDEPNPI